MCPRVDADGLELGGVRMPDLDVPVATYTGWNPRHHDTGGTGQIISMNGSTYRSPLTAELRRISCDPRASIAERYPAAMTTWHVSEPRPRPCKDRYMLEEDIDLAVEIAAERWDEFVGS